MEASHLKAILHRPFLNLQKDSISHFYGAAALVAGDMLAQGAERIPIWIQRGFPSDFRQQIIHETGEYEYSAETPEDLKAELRSPAWESLVQACRKWDFLSGVEAENLMRVLFSLGFYGYAIDLLSSSIKQGHLQEGWIYFQIAIARLRQYRSGYVDASEISNISDLFERSIVDKNASATTHLNAHIYLFLVNLIDLHNFDEARHHLARSRSILDDLKSDLPEFEYSIRLSSWHRAAAMLPFSQGDTGSTRQHMAECAHLAHASEPASRIEEVVKIDNIYSVNQSTMKEFLGGGQFQAARDCISKQLREFPMDSVAYCELGEVCAAEGDYRSATVAFRCASAFGPPASAIAQFYAGQAYCALTKKPHALRHFLACLKLDKEAISAAEELQDLSRHYFPEIYSNLDLAA